MHAHTHARTRTHTHTHTQTHSTKDLDQPKQVTPATLDAGSTARYPSWTLPPWPQAADLPHQQPPPPAPPSLLPIFWEFVEGVWEVFLGGVKAAFAKVLLATHKGLVPKRTHWGQQKGVSESQRRNQLRPLPLTRPSACLCGGFFTLYGARSPFSRASAFFNLLIRPLLRLMRLLLAPALPTSFLALVHLALNCKRLAVTRRRQAFTTTTTTKYIPSGTTCHSVTCHLLSLMEMQPPNSPLVFLLPMEMAHKKRVVSVARSQQVTLEQEVVFHRPQLLIPKGPSATLAKRQASCIVGL